MSEKPHELGPEAYYFAALKEGRFLIQRCTGCARAVFPPRIVCPHCMSEALDEVAPAGTGTVFSTTTVRRKPEQGGDYDVSLIHLDEGVQMMSCVTGIAPDAVRIGMRVRAEVVDGRVEFAPVEDAT
jgi:uncharacterized OB-fold protein